MKEGEHRSMATRKYTQARKENNKKWDAANLDRVSIAIPKGRKDIIKAAAAAAGESMNQYIVTAVDERMERGKSVNGSTGRAAQNQIEQDNTAPDSEK